MLLTTQQWQRQPFSIVGKSPSSSSSVRNEEEEKATSSSPPPSILAVLFLLLSLVVVMVSTHHHMHPTCRSSLAFATSSSAFFTMIPDVVTLAEATITPNQYSSELANKTNLFANSTRKLCFMWSGLITDKGHTEAHHLSRISLLEALKTNYGTNTSHNITFVDYVVQNSAASTDYDAQLKSVMDQGCDYFYAAYHDFASPAMLLPYANANPNMVIILAGADAWSNSLPRNFIVAEPLCDKEWFLAGYIAGKVARLATPSNPRLGMVIPWLDQQTYAPHAFAKGIHRAEPQVSLTVIAVGSWGDADLDEAATLLLLDDKKTDVIASTMNLPTANSEARRLNKFSVGWHYDRRSQFGDTVLVSVLRTFDEVFYNTLQDWMFNISRASFQSFSCELSEVGPGAGSSTINDFNAIKSTINSTVDVWGQPLYYQNGSIATSALLDDARTQLGLSFVPNSSLAGPQFQYVTSCPGGHYGSRVLSPVVDLNCIECPADTYAAAGSTSCTKCEGSETSDVGATSCRSHFWETTNILLISFGAFIFICLVIIVCAIVYCVSRRRRHAAKKETEEARRINWVMAAMTKMNTEGTGGGMMGSASNPSNPSGSNGGVVISIPTSSAAAYDYNYPPNNNSSSMILSGILKKPTPLNNTHGGGGGMSAIGEDDSSDENGSIDSGIPYGGRRDHTVSVSNSSFRKQKGGGRNTNRGDAQFFLPSMQIAGAHNGIVFGNNDMGAAHSTRSSGSQPSSNRGRNGSSLIPPIECLSPISYTNNNNASSSAAQRSFEGERTERRDLVLSKNYYVGQPIVVSVGGPQLHKVVLSNGTTISLREEYGVAGSTKSEMERLTRLPSHPNVLDHYCVTYTPETGATCFFQELFSTGQTLKSTIEELDRPLSEFTAKAFVKQLLSGLSFIHSHRIAHRNLQLRNILVSNSGRIKISEFSSAKGVEQGCDQSLTVVASPECTPPELITGKYVLSDEYDQATKGDVWNLGVLVTEVLNRGHGPWPMNCNKVQEIVKFLASDEDPTMPSGISDTVRSFLQACLNRDPSKRWSVAQLERHPWITGQHVVEESARNSASYTSSNSHHNEITSSTSTTGSISKFALVRDIGHGAFGTVYEAVLAATGQLIAVKSISYDSRHTSASSRLKKVMKEINVMESLEHPNIVQYYFLEKGPLTNHGSQTIYIAMEYVTGGTLRQLMRTSAEILEGSTQINVTNTSDDAGFPKTEDDDDEVGSGKGLFTGSKLRRMGEREAAYFTAHMLVGLSYLHGKGFIHRDVKPSNCLIRAGTEKYPEAEAKAFLHTHAAPYLHNNSNTASSIELMELIAAASCSADVSHHSRPSSSTQQHQSPRKQVSAISNASSCPGQTPSVSMGMSNTVLNGGDNTPPSDTQADPSAINDSDQQNGDTTNNQYYTRLTLKLADFGTAVAVQDGLAPGGVVETVSTNMQGTLLYMAPEIIKEEVPSIKADVWSVGASTLELVTGDHPWSHVLTNMSTFALVSLVTSDEVVTLPTPDVPMSDELKDFLMLCFDKRAESRPSAAELLQHPWITNITTTSTTSS